MGLLVAKAAPVPLPGAGLGWVVDLTSAVCTPRRGASNRRQTLPLDLSAISGAHSTGAAEFRLWSASPTAATTSGSSEALRAFSRKTHLRSERLGAVFAGKLSSWQPRFQVAILQVAAGACGSFGASSGTVTLAQRCSPDWVSVSFLPAWVVQAALRSASSAQA